MNSAYKQVAISTSSLDVAFVAVYNPKTKRAEIFQLLAAPLVQHEVFTHFLDYPMRCGTLVSRLSTSPGVASLTTMWFLALRSRQRTPKAQWKCFPFLGLEICYGR